MGLIQDLYAAHKDNQTFLHTRFGLGEDVLKPYKETLDRWLWPDALRNQDTSVAKAKQAISSYRKAVGEPAGLAELMVFYCERAAGFSNDVGYQDEGYFDALVHMFEQALKVTRQLSAGDRDALIVRLDRVRTISHNLGYGVGDAMDSLLAQLHRHLTALRQTGSLSHRHASHPHRKLTMHSKGCTASKKFLAAKGTFGSLRGKRRTFCYLHQKRWFVRFTTLAALGSNNAKLLRAR